MLGFHVITVANWQLGSSVGSGATSSVFSATSSSVDPCPLKEYFVLKIPSLLSSSPYHRYLISLSS